LTVAQHSEVNKMGIPNLAIVLGPNLLRPRHESMLRMVEDSRHVNGVMSSLLVHFDFLVLGTGPMPQEAVSTTETKDAGEGAEDTADGVMAAEERFASIREAQAGGGDDVPASLCPDFDLENPLSYATRKLKRIHAETQRPFDLKQMDAAQRQAERACLKYQLRNYDLAFQNRYGHFPSKKEKESLRPLYVRYRALSDMASPPQDASPSHDDQENVTPEESLVSPDASLEDLQARKTTLQKFLCQYETTFATQNRRPVEYLQDREPVQKEYAEYRMVKRRIHQLTGQ